MIYKESFINLLRDMFGPKRIKLKSSNGDIIIPCPYCESGMNKSHYHCYIKKDEPIFHCFYCHESGTINRLVKDLTGSHKDLSSFIVDSKLKEIKEGGGYSYWKRHGNNKGNSTLVPNLISPSQRKGKELYLPPLGDFKLKRIYLQGRLGYLIEPEEIPGLVFDIISFVNNNNVLVKNRTLLPYFQSNFIGFVTKHKTKLILRNINSSSSFRYYKMDLVDFSWPLLDYYEIDGGDRTFSNSTIILAEGIFDILSEKLIDSTGLYKSARLYACGLSTSYTSLLESVCYDEQLFQVDLRILSDDNIPKYYYEKWLRRVKHLIKSCHIYYNSKGKDFNTFPLHPIQDSIFSTNHFQHYKR